MTDDVDDLFGDYSLPDPNMVNKAPPPPQGGRSPAPGSGYGQQKGYSTSTASKTGYDPTPDVKSELAQLDQELEQTRPTMNPNYRGPPRGRGETVARVAGPLGIASVVLALFFVGSIIGELALESGGYVSSMACLFGVPLGALLSLGAIVLGIIALVLGAGAYKSKAIFSIVFGILFWIILGAFFILTVFIISYEVNSMEELISFISV